MKHVSILIPEGTLANQIDGVHELFLEANSFASEKKLPPPFEIQLVGLSREIKLKNGLFSVFPALLAEVPQTDLVIVPPAFLGNFKDTIEANAEIVAWMKQQYERGAEVATLCISSFLLASTGLLEAKRCSTNWMVIHDFKSMFPNITVVVDKIITDENGIYTSGGGYSYLNLILYLIEKYVGREAAIHCSKVYQIDMDRISQSPFIIFDGQRSHTDDLVKRAQELIEKNFRDDITLDQLAETLCVSKRNLEMRFKQATTITLGQYIQRVKIEGAKRDLELTSKNINEVMMDVGYADIKAFRAVFKRITGLTPTAYKNKYATLKMA